MEGQTFSEDGIKLFGIQGKEIKAKVCFHTQQEAGRKVDRTAKGQSSETQKTLSLTVLIKIPTPSDFFATKETCREKAT